MNEQQWQKDVKQFGELAYLMYKLQCLGMYFDGIKPTGKYRTFVANHEWDYNSKFDIRRKQSAALPFDLAAANSGDIVERLLCGEWIETHAKKWELIGKMVQFEDYNDFLHEISIDRVRMKHPRRVGVDYSKFEG